MKWVQNATIMSPIGASEVVWHDVKHVWIFLKLAKFYGQKRHQRKCPQVIATTTDNRKATWPPTPEIFICVEISFGGS